MAAAPVRSPLTVDELLTAVGQLPPAELREFQRRFAAWSGQNHRPDRDSAMTEDEEALLAVIRENSTLPLQEQRRFNRLRRKRETELLTASEETQLQGLWRRVEQMNAARLEALGEIARRRGMEVRTLMGELGIPENFHVF